MWHERLGHLDPQSVNKLKNGLAIGVKFDGNKEDDCKVCCLGKQTRLKFNKTGSCASELLEVVHTDLCGPFPESFGGSKYFLTFTFDFSRKIFVYFLARKDESEMVQKMNSFLAMAEHQ